QRDADRAPVARCQALRDRRRRVRDPPLADRSRTLRGDRMMIRTPFSEALRLYSPIIQAPMAGSPSSPELVAACSAAGVLGSFGHAYTEAGGMKKRRGGGGAKTETR